MAAFVEKIGEPTVLEKFAGRKSNSTGASEQIRLEVVEFNGKMLTSATVWFQAEKPSGKGDGFRPTRVRFTIREHELDRWIDALEKVRAKVRAEGRPTDDGHPPRPGGTPTTPTRPHQGPRGTTRYREWTPPPVEAKPYRGIPESRPLLDAVAKPDTFDEFEGQRS